MADSEKPAPASKQLDLKPVPLPSPVQRFLRTPLGRVTLFALVLALVGGVLTTINLQGGLRYFKVRITSGNQHGNYFAVVQKLGEQAKLKKGRIENLSSAGSVENVKRLSEPGCPAHFGLVQAGTPVPEGVTVVGRLPKAESVLLLGKDADQVKSWKDLAKKRIGVGAEGSGSAHLAQELFALEDLATLEVVRETHVVPQAIRMAAEGKLDFAFLVIDEDAQILREAIQKHGLSVASIPHADVIARRIPGLRTGRIGAGQFDAVRLLPAEDKRVLRVDTMVLAAPCASRSQLVGMLVLLDDAFPEFVRHNRENPPPDDTEQAPAAKEFIVHQGPDTLDRYVPWLSDVMAPGNWVYLIMGISVLFNAMGVFHRFRLWRIDAARVGAEDELARLFWPNVTATDILRKEPEPRMLETEYLTSIGDLVRDLETLATRVRAQSQSMIAPMGQEMVYRYQEHLIRDLVAALRSFRERCRDARKREVRESVV